MSVRDDGNPSVVPSLSPQASNCEQIAAPKNTGHDCKNLCSTWNLDHTFLPIGRPTDNAVVERFIQTLKVEAIWTRDWTSEDELRAAVHVLLPFEIDRSP